MRLLLIEDDPYISDVILRGLTNRGMSVEIAADGQTGLEMAERGSYELIILDLKLPRMDGTSVCRALRSQGITTPVLMLTALGASNDMELAFRHGADDYMVKPFDFNTLISRIRTLVRLGDDDNATIITAGKLVVDLTRRTVTRNGQRVGISDMEFALLECLLRHRGDVVTNETLYEALGNIRVDPRSTMIDTLIGLLSRNLGTPEFPAPIEAVNAKGYRFVSD